MKTNRNHLPFFIFSIMVVIVMIGAYFYMYNFVWSSADRANDIRTKIKLEKENTAHEQNITELYKSTAADWDRLPKFFVPSDRVVAFIESIESLGLKSGAEVSLSSVSADNLDDAVSGTLGDVKGRVDASGSWSSVMRALMLTESMPYPVMINHVVLSSSGPSDKSQNNQWRLSFDIQTKEMVPIKTSSSK